MSKEILDIIERCSGIGSISKETDEALGKLHKNIDKELNIEHNENLDDCKYALIDRFTLRTVLNYLEKGNE